MSPAKKTTSEAAPAAKPAKPSPYPVQMVKGTTKVSVRKGDVAAWEKAGYKKVE